jgi:hypothetical protein
MGKGVWMRTTIFTNEERHEETASLYLVHKKERTKDKNS